MLSIQADPRGRPQSRPIVITIFKQSVRPSQNFKIKRQSLPAWTVGWPSGSLITPVLLFFSLQAALRDTLDHFHIPEVLLPIDIDDIPESFGLMKLANESKSYYTINHGRFDKIKYMNIEKYNGAPELPDYWWPDAPATPSGQDSGLKGICK